MAIVIVGAMILFPILITCIGVLMSKVDIGITNQFKFHIKEKQSEGKVNLLSLFAAQAAYFGEHNAYAQPGGRSGESCFDKLGWKPPRPSAYNFFCGDEILFCSTPRCDPCPGTQILSKINQGSFTLMAVGNVDYDANCDIWTINDAGNLKLLVNDYDN